MPLVQIRFGLCSAALKSGVGKDSVVRGEFLSIYQQLCMPLDTEDRGYYLATTASDRMLRQSLKVTGNYNTVDSSEESLLNVWGWCE